MGGSTHWEHQKAHHFLTRHCILCSFSSSSCSCCSLHFSHAHLASSTSCSQHCHSTSSCSTCQITLCLTLQQAAPALFLSCLLRRAISTLITIIPCNCILVHLGLLFVTNRPSMSQHTGRAGKSVQQRDQSSYCTIPHIPVGASLGAGCHTFFDAPMHYPVLNFFYFLPRLPP